MYDLAGLRNDFFGNPYILDHPDSNRLGFAILSAKIVYDTFRF